MQEGVSSIPLETGDPLIVHISKIVHCIVGRKVHVECSLKNVLSLRSGARDGCRILGIARLDKAIETPTARDVRICHIPSSIRPSESDRGQRLARKKSNVQNAISIRGGWGITRMIC